MIKYTVVAATGLLAFAGCNKPSAQSLPILWYKLMELRSPFDAPVFPVVLKVGAGVLCAATPSELESYVTNHAAELPDECELIDYEWEGWELLPKEGLISPRFMTKSYTKREFLLFCGVSEQQVANINLNRSTREAVFDHILQLAQRKQ